VDYALILHDRREGRFELGSEESRRGLQDPIGPPQLSVLPLSPRTSADSCIEVPARVPEST